MQWYKHSHDRTLQTHTHMHTFFPPSELIHSCYSNIKVIKHAVRGERERNREGERDRKRDRLWCNSCIFLFNFVFWDIGAVYSVCLCCVSVSVIIVCITLDIQFNCSLERHCGALKKKGLHSKKDA